MTTLMLHAGLSWTGSHEEDRRFRRILLQTLLLSLAAGAVTPYIRVPQSAAWVVEELPPRRVRLLAEQPRPVVKPEPGPAPLPVPPAPSVTAPEPPPAVSEQPPPVAPVVTPREKAARSGVLALSDALAELQGRVPETGAGSRQEDATGQVYTSPQPSMLTANVTRGSKGIEGGVAHESVLGAAALPESVASGPGASRSTGRVATKGRLSAPPSGMVRSEEEIQEVLDRNKGAMYTLYNRELRKDPTLQGKLVMSITIAPTGKVTRCVILSSELGAASLEQQLVALIKRIDFGDKPGVVAVTTKIPVEFFPR